MEDTNATVAAKKINAGKGIVGYKKVLEYYVGERPNGVKTCWLMHEYSSESSSVDNEKVDHALIYLTSKGAKKKKADQEEENEKLKKDEEAVEHLDLHQPDQSQLHDMVHQQPQYCLLDMIDAWLKTVEEQHSVSVECRYSAATTTRAMYTDSSSGYGVSTAREPVIPEDYEVFVADFIKPHSFQ
ncbi:PREDICTED: NAC transcription factor 29-like [Camelina sativa]|uniref:NAC transcription factor 29-like n=1 Tax=Camelina sativa TaxID=90675 RepID=A0ABM0TU36_CAMSA|nr:PREDICTED: NAC transcription factor 29-like [Camelina sativa]